MRFFYSRTRVPRWHLEIKKLSSPTYASTLVLPSSENPHREHNNKWCPTVRFDSCHKCTEFLA